MHSITIQPTPVKDMKPDDLFRDGGSASDRLRMKALAWKDA